jgi:hypothetical protein
MNLCLGPGLPLKKVFETYIYVMNYAQR